MRGEFGHEGITLPVIVVAFAFPAARAFVCSMLFAWSTFNKLELPTVNNQCAEEEHVNVWVMALSPRKFR